MNFLVWLIFVVLLISVDFSLQSSIAFDRSSAVWTAWFYTIAGIRVADLILVGLTVATGAAVLLRWTSRPLRSYYLALPALGVVYLGVGGVYNLFVYYAPKDYLYDVGVVMFLAVPYLALHYLASSGLQNWFTPQRILALAAAGTVIDFVIVTLKGTVEYPSYLGLPPILTLVPLGVSAAGIIYAPGRRYRLLFLILLTAELISVVNRVALSQLATLAGDIVFILLLPRIRQRTAQSAFVIVAIVAFNVASVIMLNNPFDWTLLSAKSAGAITRQVQIDNVFINYQYNLPIFIGKGLGATWFDYVPVPRGDIYSVGTSVGDTPEESVASAAKFIFNFGPPALLYKWGVVGGILLAWLLARFYGRNREALDASGMDPASSEAKWLRFALMIAFLFALHNFTYIGALRDSFMTSLLAFYIENRALSRGLHSSPPTPRPLLRTIDT